MHNTVLMGSVCGRYYVWTRQRGATLKHGPFNHYTDAQCFAAGECIRLGLPRAYVGVPVLT